MLKWLSSWSRTFLTDVESAAAVFQIWTLLLIIHHTDHFLTLPATKWDYLHYKPLHTFDFFLYLFSLNPPDQNLRSWRRLWNKLASLEVCVILLQRVSLSAFVILVACVKHFVCFTVSMIFLVFVSLCGFAARERVDVLHILGVRMRLTSKRLVLESYWVAHWHIY